MVTARRMLPLQHFFLNRRGLTPAHIAVMTDDEFSMLGRAVGPVTLAQKNELPAPPDDLAVQLRADVEAAIAKMNTDADEFWRDHKERRARELAEEEVRKASRQAIREKALPLAVGLVARYNLADHATQTTAASAATWARAISEYFADYLADGRDNRERLK